MTNSNRAPTVPVVHAPRLQSEVTTLQPALELENSADLDTDPLMLTYEYELYADQALTELVASHASVVEGSLITSWTAPLTLNDNTRYWWRGRASDGSAVSQWTEEGSFFVNTANDAPGVFTNASPAMGAQVATLRPELRVTNSTDSDGD